MPARPGRTCRCPYRRTRPCGPSASPPPRPTRCSRPAATGISIAATTAEIRGASSGASSARCHRSSGSRGRRSRALAAVRAPEQEGAMRDGFRAFDADTHVNPAAEVLDRYVDPDFRPRLVELAPYRVATGQMIGGTAATNQYRVGTKFYRRVLGQAGPHESFTGRGTHWMGSKQPRVGVQDD